MITKKSRLTKTKIRNSKKRSMTEEENSSDDITAPKAGLPPLKTLVEAIG